ncbi:hypothetical protein [Aneurinibacillus migulanus]|uniref:Uncharacterized protein n=1 Tax=Aneurinibacillus migulanus TaxID=47500 RepID=A0A0D1V9S2_ANEMI|nr:hypothetical protein [Aneurinibacillus migulanus]KIV56144.1 hypothetical protein TS65_12970 [Aneurinibacillus migulanus]KON84206.1 hypothetical protein AF333_30120 [Aneurinibacillus migulanus]MCP1357232.1 hypothetical protein [Aneurinibacillus migulanus]MED0895331.1 hypothetical protein [Aneurinibacillus migulanus]MED1616110.1 hypothetical protein [Aneurinibacillus migulanus]
MEVGDSEKEEIGCALRSSRRKASVSFSDRPSFFSSLSPQEFVDLSNQMYINVAVKGESIIRFLPVVLLEKPASFS